MALSFDLADDTYELLKGKKLPYERLFAHKPEYQELRSRFDSVIQGVVTSVMLRSLLKQWDSEKYNVLPRHLIEIDCQNILKLDFAVYKRDFNKCSPYQVDKPEIAFIVDVRIDPIMAFDSSHDYILCKSQALLDFGAKHVCWILTKSEEIMHFNTHGIDDSVKVWSHDIVFDDRYSLNLDALIRSEGYR